MKYKIPALILCTAIIGGGLYMNFHESPEPVKVDEKKIPQSKPIQGFGIVDLEQVKAVSPDGELLNDLLSREKRLRLELDALLIPYQKPKELDIPEIDEKPFNKATYEKNMQNIISQMAELKAKKTRLTEQFRRESRDEYIRRRDAVHEVYLNRALNITLKLQNADNLQLTAEEVKNLQIELDEIVAERNKKQGEMLAQWTAEINERVEKEIAPEEERIKREAHDNLEKSRDETNKKIQELQERNKNLMETATKEIEARQTRRKEILTELTEVTEERTALENKIIDSIIDEVGKLGAMNRLEAVFVKSNASAERKSEFFDENKFDFNLKKSPGAVIYTTKNTLDLTKDLIKAIELKNTQGVKIESEIQ